MRDRWRTTAGTAALFGVFILAGGAFADEEKKVLEVGKWYPSLESGLNFTQSSYSDNWSGGDKGSLVWAFITNGQLESRLKPSVNWKNQLKLAFGQTHQQVVRDDKSRGWDRPEKSTDLVDFETVFRFTLGWIVDPYVSGRFESQFQDVTDPAGRTINFNPLKFKESGGVARQFMMTEERELLSRIGFTFRQSNRRFFEYPDSLALGDGTTGESTNDGGLEWVTDYKTKVLEDKVTWTSKLSLYQPVFYSFSDRLDALPGDALTLAGLPSDVSDYPMALDVDWENIFSTQITSYLSVNLYLRWLYDKYDNTVPPVLDENDDLGNGPDVLAAIRKAGQFKQTMSIGLTYRFL
ncbi:MAG: DUF3078 domain-containing protein [Candidatus Eisenbacteria bacterium]